MDKFALISTLVDCLCEMDKERTDWRVIVETCIPPMDGEASCGVDMYYMIDGTSDCGETVLNDGEYYLASSEGCGRVCTYKDVINYFVKLISTCDIVTRIYKDSY